MAGLRATAIGSVWLLLALAICAAPAVADDYPTRSIRLIIPFAPGGSNDVVGRIIANQLGQKLGQQVFVDNRAGAGGVVGSDLAAKATPDGYTLLIVSVAHVVDPWLYKEPFDAVKDFVPVSIIATGTNVLSVNPNVPVHSVKELLDLAKEKPGFLNYASAGIGSFQHLSGELFKLMAGVDIVHVPYKGGGPAMLAVIAGEDQVMFSSIVQTVPNIQSGQLRALATGGEKRSPILPDLPTIAEAGVPGYVATNWWGIVAPAGTPQPIVDKLHDAIAALLDSPETKKFLDNEGAAPVLMSSAEFGTFIAAELAKWGPVVKQAGMKAE
ncbi:MAG TPA: tripartite tricarboxylate transporter substrate binding protein [Xanthobacteraceae bacterium]|nr:tripartite tricarboxylate transporter substrate binding protein [Xanthobacteraceae bacterium]